MGQTVSSSTTRHHPADGVPDQLCTPPSNGLYKNKLAATDVKRIRRLVKAGSLAPFAPGCEAEDTDVGLEECPICFLNFPFLNQATCCAKRLCTECYIQVHATAPQAGCAGCPFCKAASFRVRFLGALSPDQRQREEAEATAVMAAQLRAHQAQFRGDQESALRRLQQSAPSFSAHSSSSTSSSASQDAVSATMAAACAFAGRQRVSPETAVEVDGAAVVGSLVQQQQQLQQQQQQQQRAAAAQQLAAINADGTHRGGRRALQRLAASELVPRGLSDLAMSLEDIEQMMLEQAIMESMGRDARVATAAT